MQGAERWHDAWWDPAPAEFSAGAALADDAAATTFEPPNHGGGAPVIEGLSEPAAMQQDRLDDAHGVREQRHVVAVVPRGG